MIYLLIRRTGTAELDCASDLQARQYAMADRETARVETPAGRIVYRRTPQGIDKWADLDVSSFHEAP